jgi:hypothetical protein
VGRKKEAQGNDSLLCWWDRLAPSSLAQWFAAFGTNVAVAYALFGDWAKITIFPPKLYQTLFRTIGAPAFADLCSVTENGRLRFHPLFPIGKS